MKFKTWRDALKPGTLFINTIPQAWLLLSVELDGEGATLTWHDITYDDIVTSKDDAIDREFHFAGHVFAVKSPVKKG